MKELEIQSVFVSVKNDIILRLDSEPLIAVTGCVKIRTCQSINTERKQGNERYYAHVNHFPYRICLAAAFKELPQKYQKGILYHEFGHILSDNESDVAADMFIYERIGIKILYCDKLDIQYI